MSKIFTIIMCLFIFTAHAQQSDFIILKKKSKTVQMFFKGSQIEFLTTSGAYRNAIITEIKNDSIYLKEYIINIVPSTLGFFFTDTVGSYRYAYNYKQIYKFNKENKKFNTGGSAAALYGGGLLISVASGVVYLADRKNFSYTLFTTGAGLAAIGYLWQKQTSKGITVGKNKYRIEYINISTKNNETTKR